MNTIFFNPSSLVGSLIAFLITNWYVTISGLLLSLTVIITMFVKIWRHSIRVESEREDEGDEIAYLLVALFAGFFFSILFVGLGTHEVAWQGTPDQVDVYHSVPFEKIMRGVFIRQHDYQLADTYKVQELHQTDDTHRHPSTGAQGVITSVKHGPLNDDLVQLTYTINDVLHQAVVKMSRNEYSALFTHVLNEPLPISVVDNKVIVDTYYQPAPTPEVVINYQIGGEKSMLMDLIKIVLMLGILVWFGIGAAMVLLILVSAIGAPKDLIKVCLLTCAFFIGTFVVAPYVPLVSGPWAKDDRQASLLVKQNGQVTYYQPDYNIGEVTQPGKLYMGKDAPEVMWGSKVTIVDIKHGEPGSDMVRLTYQTPIERNHIYVKMTDAQFRYLYCHLGLRLTAVISNGDVVIQP